MSSIATRSRWAQGTLTPSWQRSRPTGMSVNPWDRATPIGARSSCDRISRSPSAVAAASLWRSAASRTTACAPRLSTTASGGAGSTCPRKRASPSSNEDLTVSSRRCAPTTTSNRRCESMTDTAIGDYAMLSDRHSAALVDLDGSIDWLCFPRFDSPSIFGRLLGDAAGHWSLRAADSTAVARRYLDRTMVLETTFRTPTGVVVVVDGLATGDGNRGHDLGRAAPHLLVRQATCTEGEVEIEIEYVPRPEYGLVVPLLEEVEGGVAATGGADVLFLSSPAPLAVADSSARGRLGLREGEQAAFALHHHKLADDDKARIWSQTEITARLDDTVSAWQSWSDLHQAYDGPWRELVHHSGRVLQALSFQPTGAICAAATTSLPEVVGGVRNWDYRHAWVRDASFTIEALWVAARPDEANEFFDYMTAAAAGSLDHGGDLQIMFGIGGERDLTERTLPHLAGWRHSAPVRVGNDAWRQRQLDVYGEVLSAGYRLSDRLFDQTARRVGPLAEPHRWDQSPALAPATRQFLVGLADIAARRWAEKDHGIWEVRGEPQHFVYSKLM